MFASQQNPLEKAVQSAYTRLQVSHPESAEVLFDRHFMQYLVPLLEQRLHSGCAPDGNWVVQLWANNVGVSPTVLKKNIATLEPLGADFIGLIRAELQDRGHRGNRASTS